VVGDVLPIVVDIVDTAGCFDVVVNCTDIRGGVGVVDGVGRMADRYR